MISQINNNNNIRSISFKKNQNTTNNQDYRQQLYNMLFKTSSNISFGWSQNVKLDIENKILDTLTDNSNKTAIVSAHVSPDGDACGSLIGIAGILKQMGVNVYPVIDDKVQHSLYQMPSVNENIPAIQYIRTSTTLINDLKTGMIKDLDLAVITDTAIPDLSSLKTLDILAKAKKIIIIDHHPDKENGLSNKAKWEEELVKRGMNKENILYWRDSNRTSASEMVGELDKEIVEEDKSKKIANYDPSYYKNYRIAIAAGICCDAGYDGKNVSRLSKNTITNAENKIENSTTNILKWLCNNSNINKPQIDLSKYTHIILPEEIDKKLNNIIEGKDKISGIEVKIPTQDSPISYMYIENKNGLIDLASKVTLPGIEITKDDILNEIKYKINQNNYIRGKGLFILATKAIETIKKGDTLNKFSLSIRSENNSPSDGLAKKVANALVEAGLGAGGGHDNATGFRSKQNISLDFKKNALPIIDKAVKEFFSKDK